MNILIDCKFNVPKLQNVGFLALLSKRWNLVWIKNVSIFIFKKIVKSKVVVNERKIWYANNFYKKLRIVSGKNVLVNN